MQISTELDRLDWMPQTCCSLLGHPVLIRSTCPQFIAEVEYLFRFFPRWTDEDLMPEFVLSVVLDSSSHPVHCVYRNQECIGCTERYSHLFRLIEWQLDIFLAETVRKYFLLHAGVVAKNHVGILLPGKSGSGKSTLTAGLLLAGYDYLSDELAVVMPDTGAVRSFAKPLTIKDLLPFPQSIRRQVLPMGKMARKAPNRGDAECPSSIWYLHPETFGAQSRPDPVAVQFIVFPRYHADAAPHLAPLSPKQAMYRLIENSVNLKQCGEVGLRVLGKLVRQSRCFALTAGALEPTVELLAQEIVDVVDPEAGFS